MPLKRFAVIGRLMILLAAGTVPMMAPSPVPAQGTYEEDEAGELGKADDHIYPSVAEVLVEKARVRGGPGFEHKPTRQLSKGVQVVVLDKEQDWLLVAEPAEPEKPLGWVHHTLLKVSEVSGLPEAEPAATEPSPTPAPSLEAAATGVVTEEAPAAPAGEAPPPTEAPVPPPVETAAPVIETPVEEKPAAPQESVTEKPAPPEEQPRPLTRFEGDTNYPVPYLRGGREYFFEVVPAYNLLTEDRNGQFDDTAFRISATAGIELGSHILAEFFYSYMAYTPGEPTHEFGGGFRWQQRVFWRLKPYADAGAFYSSLFEDDNLGLRAGGGLTLIVLKKPYEVSVGPVAQYNRVFLNSPGDLENWVLGWAVIFADRIFD